MQELTSQASDQVVEAQAPGRGVGPGRRRMAKALSVAVALVLLLDSPAGALEAADRLAEDGEPRFELRVPVVYYHHVRCPPPATTTPGLFICPEQFEAQLEYAARHGWRTITADQLADLFAERRCPEHRLFVVSLDDGAADGYDNAAPILERLGMRGTFFVNPGKAGDPRFVNFDQMRDLIARGHAIGSHGLNHRSLPRLEPEVLYAEIEGAQQAFDDELGFRPRTFAYPYGRFDDAAVAQVAASGIELAFRVGRGVRESSLAPLLSKRLRIPPADTGADVLAKLEPHAEGCPPPTADLAIGLAAGGPLRGGNLYADEPTRAQTARHTGVLAGQTYSYSVRLENDGQFADVFRITATSIGSRSAEARYWIGGEDVTAQVNAGIYSTQQVEPWGTLTIGIELRPLQQGAAGERVGIVLRAWPVTRPEHQDVARAVGVF